MAQVLSDIMAQVLSDINAWLATEQTAFKFIRRENAYKAVPGIVRDSMFGWSEADLENLGVTVRGQGEILVQINKHTIWEHYVSSQRHSILNAMLGNSASASAGRWCEAWWLLFTELSIDIAIIDELSLQDRAAQEIAKSLCFPTPTICNQLDMLPTYRATFLMLAKSLPCSLALKATQSYIIRAHVDFVEYRADQWSLGNDYLDSIEYTPPTFNLPQGDAWDTMSDEGYITCSDEEDWG